MTELEQLNDCIKSAEQDMLKAERYYHHAVQYDNFMEWNAALAECRDLQANLIALVKQRDDMLDASK